MQKNNAIYIIATPKDKRQAAQLTSSNSLCGDKFNLSIDSRKSVVSIQNKFNHYVAELNEENSKQIKLWHNKGLEVVSLLSCVFYCEPERNHSAEFLILAYPKKNSEAYENFIETVSSKFAEGNRPYVNLDEFERKEIEKSNGNYKITKFLTKPKLDKGTVILKNKQTFMEKIIEAGRQKKIGCYLGSILFLLLLTALVVWIILKLLNV